MPDEPDTTDLRVESILWDGFLRAHESDLPQTDDEEDDD